jgi:DNA-binding XRE family transcriptional regulator
MIISPQQIKAARAWLDWTRESLAEKSGLSPATIRNLERGNMSMRSAEDVRAALEQAGFQFHGQAGFSFQNKESRIYDGPHSREDFHEDLLTTVSVKGGEINAIFESQAHLARALGVTNFGRPERLERLGKLATAKCLLADARQLQLSAPSFQFRTNAHIRVSPGASMIYGDKTAIIMTDGVSFTIHVTRDVGIAQNGLRQFASDWQSALPVSQQSASNSSTRRS